MRKFCLTIIVLAGFSKALFAQFGNCTASEMQTYTDRETGNTITILTDTLKNDRFLYQTDPMWTHDGKYLLFRSSSRANDKKIERTLPNGEKRSWTPTQIYFIEMATGQIRLQKVLIWVVHSWPIRAIVCSSAEKKKKTGICM